MRTIWKRCLIAVAGVTLAACGNQPQAEPAAQAQPPAQTAAADTGASGGAMMGTGMMGAGGGTGMMGGMSGMQMGEQMMAQMQGMQGMKSDSMMQMMPMHRQMLDNMMSQMDREVQGMGMKADPKWSALEDSLKGDLGRMQRMSAAEMQSFMAAHHARVTRMIEMHRAMMGTSAPPK